ncbi:MAG TPA: oxidoreductase [Firmicutes bacterium]|nr:oxidoreductase [Bacillota bacterium]
MLFERTKIGNLNVKNHFIKSATWEKSATDGSHMTEYLYQHYKELARGGVGTIILSYAHVLATEQPNPNMLGIYDDSFIPEYKTLTDLVHKEDVKIVAQLVYGGNMTNYKVEERDILSPSGIATREDRPTGRAFNPEDVSVLIDGFKQAAVRAKEAGFDAVQIHSAHGYFFSQLISPVYNKRTDEYGIDKGRLIYEVYEGMREAVGDEFPIWIKINCKDFLPGGSEVEDVIKICQKLEALGIDAIEVSGGHGIISGETYGRKKILKLEDEGTFEKETIAIANAVNIPVIMVGGIRSIAYINKIYETTKIKYFSIARPLICERDLINKWIQNPDQRARCVSCGNCFGQINGVRYACILER